MLVRTVRTGWEIIYLVLLTMFFRENVSSSFHTQLQAIVLLYNYHNGLPSTHKNDKLQIDTSVPRGRVRYSSLEGAL